MYFVNLSHAINPDISGGYWEQPTDSGITEKVVCESLQDAAQKCLDYIDRNRLGGSNWTGGAVFCDSLSGSKQVASVSYNGRIWDMTGQEIQ